MTAPTASPISQCVPWIRVSHFGVEGSPDDGSRRRKAANAQTRSALPSRTSSAEAARISLATLVLKLTCPGVPDIYQGDELEALALVDPDNRRPVDWDRLAQLLGSSPLRGPGPEPKLWLTSRLLDLRRSHPRAFARGYMPLAAAPDVCAFMRGPDVLVVVPLAPSASPEVDVAGDWHDVLEERFPFRVYLNGRVLRSSPELD